MRCLVKTLWKSKYVMYSHYIYWYLYICPLCCKVGEAQGDNSTQPANIDLPIHRICITVQSNLCLKTSKEGNPTSRGSLLHWGTALTVKKLFLKLSQKILIAEWITIISLYFVCVCSISPSFIIAGIGDKTLKNNYRACCACTIWQLLLLDEQELCDASRWPAAWFCHHTKETNLSCSMSNRANKDPNRASKTPLSRRLQTSTPVQSVFSQSNCSSCSSSPTVQQCKRQRKKKPTQLPSSSLLPASSSPGGSRTSLDCDASASELKAPVADLAFPTSVSSFRIGREDRSQ